MLEAALSVTERRQLPLEHASLNDITRNFEHASFGQTIEHASRYREANVHSSAVVSNWWRNFQTSDDASREAWRRPEAHCLNQIHDASGLPSARGQLRRLNQTDCWYYSVAKCDLMRRGPVVSTSSFILQSRLSQEKFTFNLQTSKAYSKRSTWLLLLNLRKLLSLQRKLARQ